MHDGGYDPVPSAANTIVCGNARFVLLSDRMIRLEWAADGVFEDRPTLAVVNRSTPKVRRTEKRAGRTLEIRTAAFRLQYRNDGKPFSRANLGVRFVVAGKEVTWRPGLRDKGNLGGTIRTLDNTKGNLKHEYVPPRRAGEPAGERWVPIDLGHGFLSRSGWALVDDSAGIPLAGKPGWATARPAGVRQDWYLLLHGHDYKAALQDATRVFGRQPLPPRYAFGYWWSRYWAYTDREIEALVTQFDQRRIPIDVMVLDMDWHLEGWTGYTWDHRYFPDPDEFLRWLKARDLKVTLNLHPAEGVGRHEAAFADMAKAMGLDPQVVERVPMDITDRRYVDAYFRLLHHPKEGQGVDFWWMDWQQGQKTAIAGLDPLPWINLLHWRDMERNPARRGRRPLIFSRYGGIGAGRYCVGFSGDTHSVWESLQYQPRFTATAANVLYGYWSHDLGGHMPGPIEPELYLRWLQFGIHSPVVRTHSSKNPEAERRVWAYPDPYGDLMAETLRRRYEMVPYIYTEARRGWETGVSLCRPMYYDWPEAAAYRCPDQYMFGGSLLVAPVLKPVSADELADVAAWLPAGRWFDTARGVMEEGGRTVRRRYLVSETPVFVRAGAIVPGQTAPPRLVAGPYRELVVTAYPGGDGAYELYEDDGISTGYQSGQGAWIRLAQRVAGRRRTLTVGPARGRYRGFRPARALEIRLPATVPPAAVTIGGRTLRWRQRPGAEGWSYDGATATVIIHLRRIDLRQATVVTVLADPRIPAGSALGLSGLFARLARVDYYNTISTHCLVLDREERLGVDALQAANRISRRPDTFRAERERLLGILAKLPAMFRRLADATNAWSPAPDPVRRHRCEKALAVLRAIRRDGALAAGPEAGARPRRERA